MSTIVTSNISDGTDTVGTEYVVNGSAKAWVNFNGTGTVAIRESFKVSSITDNGTGNYTVNFASALVDANYAALISSSGASQSVVARTTTSTTLRTGNSNNQVQDHEYIGAGVIR